jgi:hypothetical protein
MYREISLSEHAADIAAFLLCGKWQGWVEMVKKTDKKMMTRNPVMPSRAQLTIFYKINQACREGGYLSGTPACLIHLTGNC